MANTVPANDCPLPADALHDADVLIKRDGLRFTGITYSRGWVRTGWYFARTPRVVHPVCEPTLEAVLGQVVLQAERVLQMRKREAANG